MFDLRQFAVLQAIHEEGSLAGAARRLHLSQPSVLHHLRALEQSLGMTLVERSPRGSQLSRIGESFLREIAPVFERLDRVERQMAEIRAHGAISFRVGTFASAGAGRLPAALRQLRERHPNQIEIREGETWDLLEMMTGRELDAALIYDMPGEPAFDAPELAIRPLWSEPFCVIAAPELVAKLGPKPSLDMLADHAWTRSRHEREVSERTLRSLCRRHGFAPSTLTRTDDYGLIHGLVREGLAVALIAASAVDTSKGVEILLSGEELGGREVRFVMSADDASAHPLARELEGLLRVRPLLRAG